MSQRPLLVDPLPGACLQVVQRVTDSRKTAPFLGCIFWRLPGAKKRRGGVDFRARKASPPGAAPDGGRNNLSRCDAPPGGRFLAPKNGVANFDKNWTQNPSKIRSGTPSKMRSGIPSKIRSGSRPFFGSVSQHADGLFKGHVILSFARLPYRRRGLHPEERARPA